MDYADATLVVLAEDVATNRVFTLNRRNFSTFGFEGRNCSRFLRKPMSPGYGAS